jgi:hypothetical protein
MLELDHVFCFVEPDGTWADQLAAAGWHLDEGVSHTGQGTRNRRLFWPEQYLELLWLDDVDEARGNPLRLDRRSDWARSGASPFGLGLRGKLPLDQLEHYWLYEDLGIPLWIHRDNERNPERPFLFVREAEADEMEALRPRTRVHTLPSQRLQGTLTAVHLSGPSPAAVPPHRGPPIRQRRGPHRMRIVVGNSGGTLAVTDLLTLSG